MSALLITSPADKISIPRDSAGKVSVSLADASYWEWCDSAKFSIRDHAGNLVWSSTASFSGGNAEKDINYTFAAGHYTLTAQTCGLIGAVHDAQSHEFDIV